MNDKLLFSQKNLDSLVSLLKINLLNLQDAIINLHNISNNPYTNRETIKLDISNAQSLIDKYLSVNLFEAFSDEDPPLVVLPHKSIQLILSVDPIDHSKYQLPWVTKETTRSQIKFDFLS